MSHSEPVPLMDLNKKARILKMLRKNIGAGKKITQKSLATELGVDQGRISRLLNGKFEREQGVVKRLCEYFDFDPNKIESPSISNINKALMEAINRNWDGSDEHAKHLAKIIDEIGEITRMHKNERV